MTNKELTVKLAMIVSTLGETTNPGESIPASTIYLALGSNLEHYNLIAGVGERMGWVQTTPETIKLTPKGREMATKLQALGV